MKTIHSILVFLFIIASNFSIAQDIAGSKDHPLITRYPGSTIGYDEVQKYQPYHIATEPETGYKQIEKWVDVEGKFTRIYYIVKASTQPVVCRKKLAAEVF